MERMVLAVTSGGSFSASAVETNMSIPGRSERFLGLFWVGSKRSFRTERSVVRVTGQSLGSWSRSQENANHTSQITDMSHSQTASWLGCEMRQVRNRASAASRITISNLCFATKDYNVPKD
ncbi:hypothetical protein Hdeb2414_s0010g00359071 [Helianthus debilis subsp. tardiflorus]